MGRVASAETVAGRPALLARAGLIAGDIKLAHSVFALPFALLGYFLARDPATGGLLVRLVLIVACMVLARTWAMVVNRLADRGFDAENPRTRRRVFASGRLGVGDGIAALAACAVLFQLAAGLFWVVDGNAWPAILALPVLGWIAFYSFTKRFSVLCHLFLGSALAASPLAAAIAAGPARLVDTPGLWWLSGMVLLWVAGFDVVYALQDIEFDRARGLRSIPQRLGWRGAVWVSRLLHAGAVVCLVLAWRADARLGPLFAPAMGLVVGLLIAEHVVLSRRGLAGLPMAFFTLNGLISLVLGAAGIADILRA